MPHVTFMKTRETREDFEWCRSSAGSETRTRASQCKWLLTSMVVPFVLLLLAGSNTQLADSLRFTSIQIPALVQRATNLWLACHYELQLGAGGEAEQLYSVKWYKNNEEFYRIIFGPALANSGAGGLQQYFTHPGVNVLMSSSNATHVRLLNASLESEGVFACEISTQNLSTIRFEKEIKVYVLPGSSLNLVGLRSFYAPGDQVELHCSSDFSRPAGALAWFINGRRVITTNNRLQAAASVSYEASPSEPKLSRSRLTLMFKLTSELLAELALSRRPQTLDGNNLSQFQLQLQRNQSKSPPSSHELAASIQIQTGRLLELMHLECRYKLAEVSDVTFVEVKVATLTGSGARNNNNRRSRRHKRAAFSSSRRRFSAQTAETEFKRRRRPSGSATVSKTLANQIQQTRCLAERDDLLELMAGSNQEAACGSGLLALQREDPVLLGPAEGLGLEGDNDDDNDDNDDNDDQGDHQRESERAQPEDRLELAPNSIVGVNCSTLGALSGGQLRHPDRIRQWSPSNEPAMNYCGDSEARRRLLISGKFQSDQTNTETSAANQRRRKQSAGNHNNNNNRHNHHHIAYISISETRSPNGSMDDNAGGRQSRKFAQGDKLSLPAESSNGAKSLDQLHDNTNNMQLRPPSAWLAPPLLEWFINNQEAPKSSASYSPELPLVGASPNRSLRDQTQQMAPPSDREHHPDRLEAAPELPSIDYREYFANFELRPIDQYLMLRLVLDKKHFMTPDSLLRLRCTSTQAQVLAVDSLDVSLFLLPNGVNSLDLIQGHKSDNQRAGGVPSKWLQRQSTIRSKHIHRQSLASQSSTQQQGQANGASKSKRIPSLWTSTQLLVLVWLMLLLPLLLMQSPNWRH